MKILNKALQYIAEKAQTVLPSEWYNRHGFHRIGESYSADATGSITTEKALSIGTFYAGAKVIAEDVGTQPFHFYQSVGSAIEVRRDHPLYPVLHDMPNPEMGSQTFVETLTLHAIIGGCGHARIERNSRQEVIALWPIMPDSIRVKRDTLNRKYYEVLEKSIWRPYPASDIFNIQGLSWSPQTSGDNLVRLARVTLGLTAAQEQYAANYFASDRTPGVVLQHPESLTSDAIAKIKELWRATVQSHDVAVVTEGMKAEFVGKTNVDSQLDEQRRFQVREVCRWLRLSPHKLAEIDVATYASVEQFQIDHLTNVLAPWNRRWRQAVYRCLLSIDERIDGFFAEHSVESFLRGDFKTQSEGFARLLERGVFSINEVRRFMNLNPIEGGDEHFIQLNMQTIIDAANGIVNESGSPQRGIVKVGRKGIAK